MSWFHDLMGFQEGTWSATRSRLRLDEDRLGSDATDRTFGVGTLTTPSLGELRTAVGATGGGDLTVSLVSGDVRAMHGAAANRDALFQVASQFNLLEMIGPDVGPEDGVTGYAHDRTQGPACAMAAGAATIFRNYLVPIGDERGQTADRQLDCLADLGDALGNGDGSLWSMRNGYALPKPGGLAAIDRRLEAASAEELCTLRDLLRLGLHSDVEATGAAALEGEVPHVSQIFCSALPVAYGREPLEAWERFGRLVLEAAYEATVYAAVLNARARGSRRVLWTQLGGGAFGNHPAWIRDAMQRALRIGRGSGLDLVIVSYRRPDRWLSQLVEEQV